MTVWCLPLIEPDVRISRIRLSEAVHRVASWLAGKAFAAISELPLPSPAPWVFLSLAGHHPVLCLLGTHQHNCPAFAPSRFPGFPRCRVGGGAPCGADLRPPLKPDVQISRIQLSQW
jgi:hypothetical protein